MGGRKRKYNHFAQKKREKKNEANTEKNYKLKNQPYDEIVRGNKDFEKYYKTQNICESESEWEEFLSSIKKSLPTSFRITGSRNEAKALLEIVQGEFFKNIINQNIDKDINNEESTSKDSKELETNEQINQNEFNDIEEIKPFPLPWYPDNLAWQMQLTRKDIRRSEMYFRLHNFLMSETDSGNISRQEAVSMIPPIVLDIQSHHKILDMCAAPGSKTAQIIELLHLSLPKEMTLPSGFVMANDVDNNRCYMLVHQAKRLNSPCIVITNHDSAVFPNLSIPVQEEKTVPLKFDRILCDVPCTGDGTLRKNPDIWLKWNAANGPNLHGVQYRILRRGVELLAIGGRLVYSTCSLNPVENEAVIHRLLIECGDSLKLFDPRHMLPGLKCKPGMKKWLMASRDLDFYEKFEDVPEKWHTVIRPQMFPPNQSDYDKYNLEKCVRILPHQQDTGAFFVTVIEKLKPLPWEKEELSTSDDKQETNLKETELASYRKKRRIGGYREDPFVFFNNDSVDVWPSIRDFYSIKTNDDNFDPTCLLTRCHTGKKKNIYFCSPIVRDLVKTNETKLKLINTGVKTFVRCDNKNMKCAFRLAQEGLHSIFPFIGESRKVVVTKQDLITMLTNNNPLEPPDITEMSEETQKRIEDLSLGSCILIFKDAYTNLNFHLVGWKGARTLRAYVAQPDTVHMLRLLGGDVSKYEKNKFVKTAPEDEEKDLEQKSNEENDNKR